MFDGEDLPFVVRLKDVDPGSLLFTQMLVWTNDVHRNILPEAAEWLNYSLAFNG